MYSDTEVWNIIDDSHLWIYDKLLLSKKLGYLCGPVGVDVPVSGQYIVRPVINLLGMGLGSDILQIEKTTDHLPVGCFWQEFFKGNHYSVDFQYGKVFRSTQGFPTSTRRFSRWCVVDHIPEIPEFLKEIFSHYPLANVEMIGDKIIECHLRGNPDFLDDPVEIIPVWDDELIDVDDRFVYVSSNDGHRLGFYKRYE
jgi:hypothetical protein